MATFDLAIQHVLAQEGGYSTDWRDRGGETRWGISKAAFPFEDIPNLTIERATWLYRQNYYNEAWEQIESQAVMTYLLDTAINMGRAPAERLCQAAVNAVGGAGTVVVDGLVGLKTIAALNRLEHEKPGAVLAEFRAQRLLRYLDIIVATPTQRAFAHGWFRRALT
jgi:lysozyme family protein